MEASYNGVSADELAEMRAKLILLGGEAPAGRSDGVTDWMLDTMIRGPLEAVPNLIAVAKHGAPSPSEQLARLRLVAALELVLSDTVEHVVRLDVSLSAGQVHWQFIGRRRRRYDTEEPAIIRVEGSRSF